MEKKYKKRWMVGRRVGGAKVMQKGDKRGRML